MNGEKTGEFSVIERFAIRQLVEGNESNSS